MASSISLVGSQIKIARKVAAADEDQFLARQAALFGQGFNPVVRGLRVGVVGAAARAVLSRCYWRGWASAFWG